MGLSVLIPYDIFGIFNPSLFLEVFVKHFLPLQNYTKMHFMLAMVSLSGKMLFEFV